MKKMLARIGGVTVLVSMVAMLVTTPANAQVVYDLGDFPFSFFGATDFHATLETSTTGTFTTEADIENFLNLATYSVTLKNGATIILELNNGNSFWDLKIEALGGGTGGATATLTATASEITLDFSTPNEITSVGLFLGLPGNILQYTQSNNVTDSNFVFVDHDAIIFANADVPYDDPFIFPAQPAVADKMVEVDMRFAGSLAVDILHVDPTTSNMVPSPLTHWQAKGRPGKAEIRGFGGSAIVDPVPVTTCLGSTGLFLSITILENPLVFTFKDLSLLFAKGGGGTACFNLITGLTEFEINITFMSGRGRFEGATGQAVIRGESESVSADVSFNGQTGRIVGWIHVPKKKK